MLNAFLLPPHKSVQSLAQCGGAHRDKGRFCDCIVCGRMRRLLAAIVADHLSFWLSIHAMMSQRCSGVSVASKLTIGVPLRPVARTR